MVQLTQNWGSLFKWPKGPFSACHSQVDAKLVDRPPRGWARASREPAMLGTNNGRRPQLDKTVRSHQRGIGRHRPTDAVAACPKHVPSERRSSGDRSGSSARILLALSAARRRRLTCLMEQETDVINVRPRTVQCPSDPRAPLLSASQPRSASSSEMSADQPYAAATAASRASWHRRAPAGGRCRGSSVDACRPLRRAERRRAPRVCRRRLTRPSRSHDEPRDPWGRR